MRCPGCTKLYEVESAEIRSETPLFQCISCDCRFSFEYPPQDPSYIECFVVPLGEEPQEAEMASDAARRQAEMKACPKCAALNGRRAKECYSCHVIFEKLEGLPQDSSLKAQPSLVRKWKNLVNNFSNESLHDEFIMACRELDALRFALLKYEELNAAQGGDPQCVQMIAKINSLMQVGLSQHKPSRAKNQPALNRPRWIKYLFWTPFGLSGFLILMGMINLAHRNLVGVGVALAIMSAGLIVMIRGRISATDFFD